MFAEIRNLFKNMVSLLTGFFFMRLFSFAATLYITQGLGPATFGVLSFGLTIALLFTMVANMGLDDLIVRSVARRHVDLHVDRRTDLRTLLGDAFMIKGLFAPLALSLALWLGWRDPAHSWLYALLLAYSLVHSYLLVICAVFRGLEQMEFQTLLLTGEMALIAVGAILAVWFTHSVTMIAGVHLLASTLALCLGYILLARKGFRPAYQWRLSTWRTLMLMALPFGLVAITLIGYDRLIVILLAALGDETAVGLFSAVHNGVLALTMLPSVVAATAFPLLARRAGKQPSEMAALTQNLVKYIIVVSTAGSGLLYLMAPRIVPFFLGAAYQPAVPLLQMLALGVPGLFLSITLIGILEATGQQKACVMRVGHALLGALPVGILGVCWGGAQGGSIAYVVNNILLAFLLWQLVNHRVTPLHAPALLFPPALAGLMMTAVAYAGRDRPPVALFATAGIVYLSVLVLQGVLGRTEFIWVRKLIYTRS